MNKGYRSVNKIIVVLLNTRPRICMILNALKLIIQMLRAVSCTTAICKWVLLQLSRVWNKSVSNQYLSRFLKWTEAQESPVSGNVTGTMHRLIILELECHWLNITDYTHASNDIKTSMNYPFDIENWTKTMTKYKQRIWECK